MGASGPGRISTRRGRARAPVHLGRLWGSQLEWVRLRAGAWAARGLKRGGPPCGQGAPGAAASTPGVWPSRATRCTAQCASARTLDPPTAGPARRRAPTRSGKPLAGAPLRAAGRHGLTHTRLPHRRVSRPRRPSLQVPRQQLETVPPMAHLGAAQQRHLPTPPRARHPAPPARRRRRRRRRANRQ